jgi:hypothetical protein
MVPLVQNGLTHQFSLPKTSSEMANIEKFLQFQDAVPCKIRAKRGCATHPRSIAERVSEYPFLYGISSISSLWVSNWLMCDPCWPGEENKNQ